jgi:hypothetical protein
MIIVDIAVPVARGRRSHICWAHVYVENVLQPLSTKKIMCAGWFQNSKITAEVPVDVLTCMGSKYSVYSALSELDGNDKNIK